MSSSDLTSHFQNEARILLGLTAEDALLCSPLPRSYLDRLGNWAQDAGDTMDRERLKALDRRLLVPEFDQWLVEEKNRLIASGTKLESRWPNGKPFAVCLTHDIDSYSSQITLRQWARSVRLSLRSNRDSLARRLFSAFRRMAKLKDCRRYPQTINSLEKIYAIEQELGLRSTFFVPVYPQIKSSRVDSFYSMSDPCTFLGEKTSVVEVFRLLASRGSEIGLHGSYHSAHSRQQLAAEKMILGKALQRKIVSARQHYLNFVPETPDYLVANQIEVDSSVGLNRQIGFKLHSSLPLRLPGSHLLEVPLVIQDSALFSKNSLQLTEEDATQLCREVLKNVADVNGCLTLSFHPEYIAQSHGERLYRLLLNVCLEGNAWFATVADLLEWRRQRESKLEGRC